MPAVHVLGQASLHVMESWGGLTCMFRLACFCRQRHSSVGWYASDAGLSLCTSLGRVAHRSVCGRVHLPSRPFGVAWRDAHADSVLLQLYLAERLFVVVEFVLV